MNRRYGTGPAPGHRPAAGLAIAALSLGFSIPELFLILAALNAVVAIYIYSLSPEFLTRFLAWVTLRGDRR